MEQPHSSHHKAQGNKWLLAIEGPFQAGGKAQSHRGPLMPGWQKAQRSSYQQWPFLALLAERVVGSVFHNLGSILGPAGILVKGPVVSVQGCLCSL